MIEELGKQSPKAHALSCDDNCILYLVLVDNKSLLLILGVFFFYRSCMKFPVEFGGEDVIFS